MSDNGKKPILDLDDLTENLGAFKLDGQRYEFRRWNALSLRERNRLGNISERIREIESLTGDEADAAEDEYSGLVHEGLSIVSTMKATQAAEADQEKVRDALNAFLGQRQARQIEMVMAMAEMTGKQIGEPSSPVSNRATRRTRRKAG